MKIPDLDDVHITELDGIPTVWVAADRPFTGAIGFRVGNMDERLPSRGITHLVEHLALSRLRDIEVTYNGSVELHKTILWAQGDPDSVFSFLADACRSLHDLPVERLPVERRVLLQEASERGFNYASLIADAYFGPRGPGLAAYPEFGLDWLGSDEITDWAERYFTKANAVLVFTGSPPAALTLDLPDGERQPLVAPERTHLPAPQTPTLLNIQDSGVSWGVLTARGAEVDDLPPLGISLPILTKRLVDRLRHDLGTVYDVSDWTISLDADLTFRYIGINCSPDDSRLVSDEFVDVMEGYAEQGPTDDELQRAVRVVEASVADRPADYLRSLAFGESDRLLCDWPPTVALSEWKAAALGSGTEAIRERFAEAYRQSYMVANPTPGRIDWPVDGLSNRSLEREGPSVTFNRRFAPGRRLSAYADNRSLDADHPVRSIEVGPEGVTIEYAVIGDPPVPFSLRMVERLTRRKSSGTGTESANAAPGERGTMVHTVGVPLSELELVLFGEWDVTLVSSIGMWVADKRYYRNGYELEGVLREHLPPELMLPRSTAGDA